MVSLSALFGRRRRGRPGHGDLRWWFEQFLELLDTVAAQDREAAAHEFRQHVSRLRYRIANPIEGEDVARTGTACLDAGRRYFAVRRAVHAEEEAGYRSVIQTLTEGLATVAAEAGSFTAQLTGASERVSALAKVDDIRALKQQLAREVGEIKRVVAEKQQRDQALHTHLTQRVAALEISLAQTQVAATLDPLTQVANRGHFDATLQQWAEVYRETNQSFVLALIDLDNFKKINDIHGHAAGDRALVGAVRTLCRMVHPGDLVARCGGDEFALLLAHVTLEQALKRAPEIVAEVARTEFANEQTGVGPTLRLTVSCGLAEWDRQETVESLKQRADGALYAAKGQGRNCAVAKRRSRRQRHCCCGQSPRAAASSS